MRKFKNINIIPRPSKREILSFILLLSIILLFSIISKNFLTYDNILRVIQNSAEIGLISIGMTLIMTLGGVDISVGSIMGVLAIIGGTLLQNGINLVFVLPIVLLSGGILSGINGLLVTKFNIPDLIISIGTMNIWRMVIFVALGGKWLTGLRSPLTKLMTLKIIGIPVLLIILLLFYFVFYYITVFRKTGRHIYATGSNIDSARMIGINVDKSRIISYFILGIMVALASLLYLARMGSVEMSIGMDTPLQCIAAVTLGGTSVAGKGSKGTLIGTLAGVLFIAFLRNGTVLLGIPSLLENLFIGLLIIGSTFLDYLLQINEERKAKLKSEVLE